MNRIGWSIALIFSAVIGLYLVILFDEEEAKTKANEDLIVVPTYQVVNLNSKIFDDNGILSHQVAATKMEHYQPLGFMVFDNPTYTVYMETGEPWQVTAEQGTLYENSRIQLERNVKILNLNEQEYVKEINTQYIEINLNDKTLLSDEPVEIVGENFNVKSIGIIGNLATQKYELKQHVRTFYSPQS
ncbi:LPS export ABC transporter periplasmic protein LptC [Glaciecola sp. 1036]|uniref:LPS export ABC transporter periplasmic protein LptC n=1 Tax=Alteromonadaceae TaxID=72275 RepID=UPI003D00F26E